MSTATKTAADLLDDERGRHYDSLTLAACVIGELEALFNALAAVRGRPGTDGDMRRLIGIGQPCWRAPNRRFRIFPGSSISIGANASASSGVGWPSVRSSHTEPGSKPRRRMTTALISSRSG